MGAVAGAVGGAIIGGAVSGVMFAASTLTDPNASWSSFDTWQNLGASVAGGAAGGAVQGAIVGAVAGAVAGVATGDLTALALVGAATVAGGMVGGAAGGATQSIVTQALSANSQGINWDKVKQDAKVGATVGGLTAGLGFAFNNLGRFLGPPASPALALAANNVERQGAQALASPTAAAIRGGPPTAFSLGVNTAAGEANNRRDAQREARATESSGAKKAQAEANAAEGVKGGSNAPTTQAARFEALAQRRVQLGLPAAGTAEDAATLARLEINGQTFNGINRGLQNPPTPITLQRVNPQTITHAEADVVQQAVDAGMGGTARRAEMWVDRDPCGACGPRGGLRSLARNLGVDELVVHSPSGTQPFTPTR